jgi:tetratricopeptide (TPR) repeat protein
VTGESREERIDRLVANIETEDDAVRQAAFAEARELLDEALSEWRDPELLWKLGYVVQSEASTLMRKALRVFERSIELDPRAANKAHHYLIRAHTALLQTKDPIAMYKQRLAAAPDDVDEYRLLASAYLWAGEYEEAGSVVQAGLELEPENTGLLESWGSVLEGRGWPDEALAVWERVYELEGDRYISSLYSRVFLLARVGRLEDAAAEWERIIAWLLEHEMPQLTPWPERELAQLRARIAAAESRGDSA